MPLWKLLARGKPKFRFYYFYSDLCFSEKKLFYANPVGIPWVRAPRPILHESNLLTEATLDEPNFKR